MFELVGFLMDWADSCHRLRREIPEGFHKRNSKSRLRAALQFSGQHAPPPTQQEDQEDATEHQEILLSV